MTRTLKCSDENQRRKIWPGVELCQIFTPCDVLCLTIVTDDLQLALAEQTVIHMHVPVTLVTSPTGVWPDVNTFDDWNARNQLICAKPKPPESKAKQSKISKLAPTKRFTSHPTCNILLLLQQGMKSWR
jgi:hypothetical protein